MKNLRDDFMETQKIFYNQQDRKIVIKAGDLQAALKKYVNTEGPAGAISGKIINFFTDATLFKYQTSLQEKKATKGLYDLLVTMVAFFD